MADETDAKSTPPGSTLLDGIPVIRGYYATPSYEIRADDVIANGIVLRTGERIVAASGAR